MTQVRLSLWLLWLFSFLLPLGIPKRKGKYAIIAIALVIWPLHGCGGAASNPPASALLVTPRGAYTVNVVINSAQIHGRFH